VSAENPVLMEKLGARVLLEVLVRRVKPGLQAERVQ
jgi:hypothetical protein